MKWYEFIALLLILLSSVCVLLIVLIGFVLVATKIYILLRF